MVCDAEWRAADSLVHVAGVRRVDRAVLEGDGVDTIATLAEPPAWAAADVEDVWQRREEMLFERLVVSWEIAGLPLDDQKMLLGRYRMADPDTRRWVRETITGHVREFIPEIGL